MKRNKPRHFGLLSSLLSVILILGAGTCQPLFISGHRGIRGLVPENTLAGFKLALQLGVDAIEVDVGMTRDKVLVAYHDSALNPTLTRWGLNHCVLNVG